MEWTARKTVLYTRPFTEENIYDTVIKSIYPQNNYNTDCDLSCRTMGPKEGNGKRQ